MISVILLFLTGYVAVLLLAVRLFHWVGLTFSEPSIPMLFVASYLLFAYLGLLPMFLGWISLANVYNATEPVAILRLWAYSGCALLLVLGGFAYGRTVLGLVPRKRSYQPATRWRLPVGRVLLILCLCIIVLNSYIRLLPGVSLLALFHGESVLTSLQLRSAATNAFRHSWRYQLFTQDIATFLSYVLWAGYLMNGRRRHFFAFILAFGVALFGLSMNLTRSDPILYLGSLVFLYYLVQRRRLRTRHIVLLLGIITLVTIGVVQLRAGTTLGGALHSSFDRVFGGSLLPSYYYLATFPGKHSFLLGQSFPNPGDVLPFQRFPLTVFMSEVIVGPVEGVVGSAPAPFWAEMYVNFGPVGVGLASLALGVVIWLIHCWTSYWPSSPVHLALITYLAFFLRRLSVTSLSPYFFPFTAFVIFLTALFLLMKFTRKRPMPHYISFS